MHREINEKSSRVIERYTLSLSNVERRQASPVNRANSGRGWVIYGIASEFWSLIGPQEPSNQWTLLMPGAFRQTLKQHPEGLPLLYFHNDEQILGHFFGEESHSGLETEMLVSDTSLGRDYATLVFDGTPMALSIGFLPVETFIAPFGDPNTEDYLPRVRYIKSVRLFEVSAVLWGADPAARCYPIGMKAVSSASVPRQFRRSFLRVEHDRRVRDRRLNALKEATEAILKSGDVQGRKRDLDLMLAQTKAILNKR